MAALVDPPAALDVDALPAWLDATQLLSQGAEARVYALDMFGRGCVAKHRFAKTYRMAELDLKLRKERMLQEVRCIVKCRQANIATPLVYMVDAAQYTIYMERVPGLTAKAYVDAFAATHRGAVEGVMRAMGSAIAKLHDAGLTHGDLTTSNFICRRGDAGNGFYEPAALVFIDFGLGGLQPQPEDKAVDLYVLERALVSTHDRSQPFLEIILEAYRSTSTHAAATLKRLDAVRARGRKRECFG
ncbi:kinase-like domain-containing protein [Pelagophyceae sp. CCMP2097]|nr:kinase-like domain-containing protein [Pelagophyceae sp. CCMP2097]